MSCLRRCTLLPQQFASSDKNDSDIRRWAFLCSYNRADNDPVYKHHHPNYTALSKVNLSVLSSDDLLFLHGTVTDSVYSESVVQLL